MVEKKNAFVSFGELHELMTQWRKTKTKGCQITTKVTNPAGNDAEAIIHGFRHRYLCPLAIKLQEERFCKLITINTYGEETEVIAASAAN